MRRKLRKYSSMVKTESAHSTASEQRNTATHFSTSSRTHPYSPAHVQNHSWFAPVNCENAIKPQTRNIKPSKYSRCFSSSVARLMNPSSTSTGHTATTKKMNIPAGEQACMRAFR